MKKLFFLLLAALCLSTAALAAFSDVPEDSWAAESIEKAAQYGLMEGSGGAFGYGEPMTRAEFVTVLVRMFGWELAESGKDRVADAAAISWAEKYVNTAADNDVLDTDVPFRPGDRITREEMAVMLVCALGLHSRAEEDSKAVLPFRDAKRNRGYIAIAAEIGMSNGTGDGTTFEPDGTAKREQAAAMLVRVYERYNRPTEWRHAFYAISSWSQVSLAGHFDAVSLGWAHMNYSAEDGVQLSTAADSSGFSLPAGYSSVVEKLEREGTKLHLCVYMAGSKLREMLKSEADRTAAVEQLCAELSRSYPDLGRSPYSGLTVDFEGLRAADRDNFTAFFAALRKRLNEDGKTLYIAVMPAVANDAYYDGYDFRALGDCADKVILMAHDYTATDLTGFVRSRYYKNLALAPLSKVYYGIRAALDGKTGMTEPDKLVLAVSMEARAWQVDENGLLTSAKSSSPLPETVIRRLRQSDSVSGWSASNRSPYLSYTTESGQHIFLWYENERSIAEKISCAKLLGVTGVSVWRLGILPDYADDGLEYNVLNVL